MKRAVNKRIKELTLFAKEKWNLDIKVKIEYNLDSARALGTYSPREKTINLNYKLLMEYKELYIEDIVVHEFAHAIIHNKYPYGTNGRKRVMPHGKEFKAVCSWFGIDGKASTSLFNDNTTMKKVNKQNTITYKCNCQEHELSKVRHNKILRGASYTCKNCRTKLEKK